MITVKCSFNGHDLTDVPVLNPGDWFGKAWLVEIGGSYTPLFLIIEGDSVFDVIDELAESEKYGHNIIVDEKDYSDYPEDDRQYSGSGQLLDLDHLMIHGSEGTENPFLCRYYGDGLPDDGVLPTEFESEF